MFKFMFHVYVPDMYSIYCGRFAKFYTSNKINMLLTPKRYLFES